MKINGRTLSQIVDDVSKKVPDCTFYIGSENGSSFFFIGNSEEFNNDVYKLNEHWYINFKRARMEGIKTTHELFENLTSYKGLAFEKRAMMAMDSIRSRMNSLTKYNDAVENWTPIENRIPKKAYVKDDILDTNGFVIILPGYEEGPAWFKHEYDTWKKKVLDKPVPDSVIRYRKAKAEDKVNKIAPKDSDFKDNIWDELGTMH